MIVLAQTYHLQILSKIDIFIMTERKKIIVVGANGNVARQIIPLLIKNYEVYCLTRSPPSFAINSIFLRFIEGDALSS
jgi:nucleoside-diphosphate-sugar epimerase